MFERAHSAVGLAIGLSMLAGGGCGRSEGPAREGPSASPPAAEAKAAAAAAKPDCTTAWGDQLERQLLAKCAVGEQLLSVDVPSVPWSAVPTGRPPGSISVTLTQAGVVVNWGQPAPIASMRVRLEEQLERARMRRKEVTWELSIAGDVGRDDVATVLQILVDVGMKSGHLTLATEPRGPIPPPRDPAVLARLAPMIEGVDAAERAMVLAREIETNMPPCPEVEAAFAAVATVEADQKCVLLAKGLSEGLVGCGCPDADELLTEIHALTVGTIAPERLAVRAPVTLDPKASAAAGGTWAEIVGGLDQAALGALWVRVD